MNISNDILSRRQLQFNKHKYRDSIQTTVKAQQRSNYPKLEARIHMFQEGRLEEMMPVLEHTGDVGVLQGQK